MLVECSESLSLLIIIPYSQDDTTQPQTSKISRKHGTYNIYIYIYIKHKHTERERERMYIIIYIIYPHIIKVSQRFFGYDFHPVVTTIKAKPIIKIQSNKTKYKAH